MPLEQHLVLIGPMGAGKSTIGRLLSEYKNCELVDLDRLIEERAGASIPWIFDIEGEEGFRERESSALEYLMKQSPCIVATGGGCVLKESNRDILSSNTFVVYLSVSIEQQLERTSKDKTRPLLQTDNPKQVLQSMAKTRTPLYSSIAALEIDTDGKPPKIVVNEVIQHLSEVML